MIDLRSDTVTRPTPDMLKAMNEADLGDDVFDDDPTVDQLEALAAETLGKETSMFVPSGTQSNLAALMTHCGRGDEYLVGQQAHTYLFEGGGGATLGCLQPQPIDQEPDGTLDLEKLAALIKPDDYHYARTRLLCLENTTWGKVLPQDYLAAAKSFADEHGLALHLDGARIFNAAVAQGISASEVAAPFDSVSACLSKGLGCPVGSVLAGPADFVKEARRWRKMLGGGMRQSGILAAAGIHALQNHVDRLTEDHEHHHRYVAIQRVSPRRWLFVQPFVSLVDNLVAAPQSIEQSKVIVKPEGMESKGLTRRSPGFIFFRELQKNGAAGDGTCGPFG